MVLLFARKVEKENKGNGRESWNEDRALASENDGESLKPRSIEQSVLIGGAGILVQVA